MAEVYSVVLVKRLHVEDAILVSADCSACCGFLKLLSHQRKNSEMIL